MRKAIVIGGLLCILCGILTAADPTDAEAQYDLGDRYFRKGKYDMAVSCCRKSRRENGYAPAQNATGGFPLYGNCGVKKDPQQTVSWFRKPKKAGLPPNVIRGNAMKRARAWKKI